MGITPIRRSALQSCRSKTLGDFVPVDDVPDRFEIIRALVLILQIVSVFPYIHAQQRFAFATGDGLALERTVLVRGRNNFQFAGIGDEPGPAAAETAQARCLELGFEIVETAERGFDGVAKLAAGSAAGLGAE